MNDDTRHKVVLLFDSEEHKQSFLAWFLDGPGEVGFAGMFEVDTGLFITFNDITDRNEDAAPATIILEAETD